MHRVPITAAYERLLSTRILRPDPAQAALANKLAHLQHSILNGNAARQGLYIYGGVGTGKSRLADLFASTLRTEIRSIRRTHFHEFMTDVHTRLHRARALPTYAGDPLVVIGDEISRESSVLCLDEFQVSDIADAMILKRLFTSFWNGGGTLISTSNRHPSDLYKNGLNRGLFIPFIEELSRKCAIFHLGGGEDYRLVDRPSYNRADAFYTNKAVFLRDLEETTHGQPLKSITIPVLMNRSLRIQAYQPAPTSRATVYATFPDLCEKYLGPNDYHALCAFAATIYLSGLRQFVADELDIVRRFITLVDIAYESRTPVLCLSTHDVLRTFKNIVLTQHDREVVPEPIAKLQDLMVKGEGGSSSSHATTFIGQMEWSATGRKEASLATGGAGETDVRFAVLRAISRLHEMASEEFRLRDQEMD